jgi:hypothetical protein
MPASNIFFSNGLVLAFCGNHSFISAANLLESYGMSFDQDIIMPNTRQWYSLDDQLIARGNHCSTGLWKRHD